MPEYYAALRDTISTDSERILWSGHTAVAEYAFDEPASLPRWTLPEETEVVVTDQRVLYRGPGAADTGELRWPWPQHLRVQPGNRDTGRQATVTQIQLVCAGPGGSFPALVFAGGDLTTVGDADRVANTLRQAIARYRVEHATDLGIAPPQLRMLSRLVIGPEFTNFPGGEGQTVSLIGAVSVETNKPVSAMPTSAAPVSTAPASPAQDARPGYATVAYPSSEIPAAERSYDIRPPVVVSGPPVVVPAPSDIRPALDSLGPVADPARPQIDVRPEVPQRRAWSARPADDATLTGQPDLDSRAADLAARVASLVAGGATAGASPLAEFENQTNLSAYLDVPPATAPRPRAAAEEWVSQSEAGDRAESVRRTAARFAGNAARVRGGSAGGSGARHDGEVGSSGRGSHRQG
ncbi:translation initiation factor 2 [Paractinoplanes lichenicola]|uniref:Translation initiation factor 2 n=1 Tax=Paractinoplanes lichenicola TaxID=2802976 RepID=A0ABS1VLJ0_9ACTN|nr:translation initiation factor 2 [Actinoplanes lichenicola]MBL7254999.1 translation initiation factor 2 [Actinoplanes lichenicola]